MFFLHELVYFIIRKESIAALMQARSFIKVLAGFPSLVPYFPVSFLPPLLIMPRVSVNTITQSLETTQTM